MSVAIERVFCGVPRRSDDDPRASHSNGRKKGEPCRNPAGWGTDHVGVGPCRKHGGSLPPVRRHGQELLADLAARKALESLSVPVTIDPESALLAMVYEAAGNVAFLGGQVAGLGGELVGDVYDITKDGERIPVKEDVRAIVKLYGEERDRLAKVSAMALGAGIAKREVALAEQHGNQIAVVVINVLQQLNLSPEMAEQARKLLAAEFREQARVPLEG